MAVVPVEAIWKLMSKYCFEADADHIHEDLTCAICRKLMIDACQSVCGCQFCYKCIKDYMGDEIKHCPGNKEECKEEYLIIKRDIVRNKRTNNKIARLRVKCPNKDCLSVKELLSMEDHLRVCCKQRVGCPYVKVGCNDAERSNVIIENHLKEESFKHARLLIEYVNNLTNEMNQLKDKLEQNQVEIATLRLESISKDTRVQDLMREMEIQRSEADSLKNNLRNMEIEIKTKKWEEDIHKRVDNVVIFCLNNRFDFIWRIEEWSKNVEAISRIGLFSDTFYSHNYKSCLYVYIHEDKIALYCYIIRGDLDNKVAWPMKRHITLSIIDQATLTAHKSRTFHYDSYEGDKNPFHKPKTDRSNYIGTDSFISQTNIKACPSVILNDVLVVSCVFGDTPG